MSQDSGDEPETPAATGVVSVPSPATTAPTSAPDASPAEATLADASAAEEAERRAHLAERRLGEVVAAYRKLKLENEGFRERVARDLERQSERRSEKLVLRFIEVFDNLDRALQSIEQTYVGNPLVEGLILVRSQLLHILQKEGLERLPVLGLPFDPELSEAVGTQAVADPDHDHVVVREVLRGYRLHGRVARAGRVIVGVYDEGAVAHAVASDDLVGADEISEQQDPIPVDPAAETMRIDEKTLQEIFGTREEPED